MTCKMTDPKISKLLIILLKIVVYLHSHIKQQLYEAYKWGKLKRHIYHGVFESVRADEGVA